MSDGVPVSATDNALDRIETAISLAFEGEAEAWSDRLSGDRLAHSARRAVEDIWDGLMAAERAKAWNEGFKSVRTRTGRFSDG